MHQDNACLYFRSHFKCHFFNETFSDSLNLNQIFLLYTVYMFFPLIINLFYNILYVTCVPFLTLYSMQKVLFFLNISLFLPFPPFLSFSSALLNPQCLAQDSFSICTLKKIVQLIYMLTDLLFLFIHTPGKVHNVYISKPIVYTYICVTTTKIKI